MTMMDLGEQTGEGENNHERSVDSCFRRNDTGGGAGMTKRGKGENKFYL